MMISFHTLRATFDCLRPYTLDLFDQGLVLLARQLGWHPHDLPYLRLNAKSPPAKPVHSEVGRIPIRSVVDLSSDPPLLCTCQQMSTRGRTRYHIECMALC